MIDQLSLLQIYPIIFQVLKREAVKMAAAAEEVQEEMDLEVDNLLHYV